MTIEFRRALGALADALQLSGSVTGVDVSEEQLARSWDMYSCLPTSTREDMHSAVFRRIPLYSLYSSPLCSRGALKHTAQNRLPARMLVYSARRYEVDS